MRFTGTTALFAPTIILALTGVNADLIAFSGFNCVGNQGDDISCNGGCIGFDTRNSFNITAAESIVTFFFSDNDCNEQVSEIINGEGTCNNVNIGTLSALSFTCNPVNAIFTTNTPGPTTIVLTTSTPPNVIGPSSTTSSSSTTSASTTLSNTTSSSTASSVSSAGSMNTASSCASPNKNFLHWSGTLLGLAAGNLLVF